MSPCSISLSATSADRNASNLTRCEKPERQNERSPLNKFKLLNNPDDHSAIAKATNFYEEVDERMSLKSVDYPQHQARYVDAWLDSTIEPNRRLSQDALIDDGNVVGIRGFDSARLHQRAEHNMLKVEYEKLRTKYNKLLARFVDQVNRHFDQKLDENNNKIGEIKLLISQQDKTHDSSTLTNGKCDVCLHHNKLISARQHREELLDEIKRLQAQLNQQELDNENRVEYHKEQTKLLSCELNSKEAEIARLKALVKNLSLEPVAKQMNRLEHENERLKKIDTSNSREFFNLHESYAQIESELMKFNQETSNKETEIDKEASHFMLELYRLQVYQHKLEQILQTELEIKLELQSKIENLERERDSLSEKLTHHAKLLQATKENNQSKSDDELERLNNVIVSLKQRYNKLREEKTAQENALKMCQQNCADLEDRLLKISEHSRNQHQSELNQNKRLVDEFGQEKNKMLEKIDKLEMRLKAALKEKNQLTLDLCALHREFELTNKPDDTKQAQELEQYDSTIKELNNQIATRESEIRELRNSLDSLKDQLEQSSKQYDELKRRYELQTESISEITSRKDKELAKLRVDLNFERYNRQMAVRGVERELRASLKELEVMKGRFSTTENSHASSTSCNQKLSHAHLLKKCPESKQVDNA